MALITAQPPIEEGADKEKAAKAASTEASTLALLTQRALRWWHADVEKHDDSKTAVKAASTAAPTLALLRRRALRWWHADAILRDTEVGSTVGEDEQELPSSNWSTVRSTAKFTTALQNRRAKVGHCTPTKLGSRSDLATEHTWNDFTKGTEDVLAARFAAVSPPKAFARPGTNLGARQPLSIGEHSDRPLSSNQL